MSVKECKRRTCLLLSHSRAHLLYIYICACLRVQFKRVLGKAPLILHFTHSRFVMGHETEWGSDTFFCTLGIFCAHKKLLHSRDCNLPTEASSYPLRSHFRTVVVVSLLNVIQLKDTLMSHGCKYAFGIFREQIAASLKNICKTRFNSALAAL